MIQEKIVKAMHTVAADSGATLAADIGPDTVLLETGLDSFGFVWLVVHLEDALGYDPFAVMEELYYPRTLQDLIEIYEKNAP